jgi:hypothetical protein
MPEIAKPITPDLSKVTYTHQAMIDLIIVEPDITHIELGKVFGFSAGWVSRVVASDSFKAQLASRKKELVDPDLSAQLNSQLRTIAVQSLDNVSQKLATGDCSADYALSALSLAITGVGFGGAV